MLLKLVLNSCTYWSSSASQMLRLQMYATGLGVKFSFLGWGVGTRVFILLIPHKITCVLYNIFEKQKSLCFVGLIPASLCDLYITFCSGTDRHIKCVLETFQSRREWQEKGGNKQGIQRFTMSRVSELRSETFSLEGKDHSSVMCCFSC